MSTDVRASQFDRECFFITPIGRTGSPERELADATLRAIVEPSAASLGLVTVRADTIDEGGHITLQVLEHCINAKVAVADLTGGNLNVYYEVGIRHAIGKPVVLMAEESTRDALPFDLLQQRTIFYTDTLEGAVDATEAVSRQLKRALEGSPDSPVQAAANLRGLEQGDAVQQTLAQLVGQVDEIARALQRNTTVLSGLPTGRPGRAGSVGARIRDLRDASGMTQEELALRSDMHRTEVSLIERGARDVRLATLARIAAGLGVELAELVPPVQDLLSRDRERDPDEAALGSTG